MAKEQPEFPKPDRQEIETALENYARDWLDSWHGRSPRPGWHLLFALGVEFKDVNSATIPVLSERKMAELVLMGRSNPHAFDAASHLSAMQIAAGWALPMPLRRFAGEVLNGEIGRPEQPGRPLSLDVILLLGQYQIIILTHELASLPIARNDASHTFSACDAVAEAFTRAGKNTTFGAMKSLCYDAAYKDVRALANWVGTGKQDFSDPKGRPGFSFVRQLD